MRPYEVEMTEEPNGTCEVCDKFITVKNPDWDDFLCDEHKEAEARLVRNQLGTERDYMRMERSYQAAKQRAEQSEALLLLVLDDIGWRGRYYMDTDLFQRAQQVIPGLEAQAGKNIPDERIKTARQTLGLKT